MISKRCKKRKWLSLDYNGNNVIILKKANNYIVIDFNYCGIGIMYNAIQIFNLRLFTKYLNTFS